MTHWNRSEAGNDACWYLENETIRLAIAAATGLIHGCTWKRTGTDLFQQLRGGIPGYIGGLRIYDEHDEQWYEDGRTPFTLESAAEEPGAITVSRRYGGAPFRVRVTYRLDGEALTWQVEVTKDAAGVADRSLRVHFMYPLIAGWDVWAPCNWGQQTFDGMTPFEFMYAQVPFVSDQEIILPMVSHFSRTLDVGYSMVEPIDAPVPAAKFAFNNVERCFTWGSMRKQSRQAPVLEAVNYFIGLVGDRPLRTAVTLFFHEGDWRPGLGQVYRRWQPFFDPFNPAIHERNGVFGGGLVQSSDRIPHLHAMGVGPLEVHGHFQDYCDYFQAGRDAWWCIAAKEALRRALLKQPGFRPPMVDGCERSDLAVNAFLASHTEDEVRALLVAAGGAEWEGAILRHRRPDVRRRLQALADAGIKCHWYFNYSDGFRARVEEEWPDAICRDEDGKPIPSGWYMCHNMNPDPEGSFGRFMIESARRIVDDYPMLDGFFLDCFRHYEIDFAHDDGVTVVHGRPAYCINHSYAAIEEIIKTRITGPRNLTSIANKPVTIRSMRYCDGQLLEGNGDTYEERFFWASIAMPLFYMWTRHDAPLDEFLRRAVLHGCYPRDERDDPAVVALYRRYLPLFGAFQRRIFCFEPDPLRSPPGSRGKLYTLPDGSYVAGIVNLHITDDDAVAWSRTPYALFRVRRGHDVARVGVLFPGDDDWREASFKFDGTFLAVPLSGYRNCAVVRLFVSGDSGKPIGSDHFHQRPRMCGDPESSFEDVSER